MRLPAAGGDGMVPLMIRKIVGLVFLWVCFAGVQAGAKGFDWPKKDGFELKDLEKAKEAAVKAKKGLAFFIVPLDLDSREKRDEEGAEGSVQITNDAIKELKGFCVIIRVNPHELSGDPSPVSNEVGEGIKAGGGFVPIVVVSDAAGTKVFGTVGAQQMQQKGKEKFREIEKKFKASQSKDGKGGEKDDEEDKKDAEKPEDGEKDKE
jgi:hypothetical protein